MSNAIWGNPTTTSDEHYPLKLLRGLLQDMLRQVPAYGACLALYDESINQMVVRLHMRSTGSGDRTELPLAETNHSAQSRRTTTQLAERAIPSSEPGSLSLDASEHFALVYTTNEHGLFPLGSAYAPGIDMIGMTWRNNQSFHVSQDQYQALRLAAKQPYVVETITPSWYLTIPLREPELTTEIVDRRLPLNRVLGVIVLYQLAPDTGFLTHQRQFARQHAEKISLYLQNDRLARAQISSRDHIKHLQHIGMTFPNSLKLSELVQEIYQFVLNTVDVSSMLLTFYDRDTKKLYDIFALDKGRPVEGLTESPAVSSVKERPHWFQMAQKEKHTILLSTGRDERREWQIYDEFLHGTWGDQTDAETFLLIPMKMFTRVVGALSITSQRANAYGPLEVLVLETMVQIITVAIENAKLYERPRLALKQAERRAASLAATVNGLQAINTVLNVNELLQKFVEIVANLVQAEMCSFFLPEGDVLVAQAIFDRTGKWKASEAEEESSDEHTDLIKLIQLPFAESGLKDMIDEPFFYLDQSQLESLSQVCSDSGKIFLGETETQKILVIPMRYQTRDFVGVVIIHTSEAQRIFHPEEVSILMAISAQAAGAIRNAQLFEQIQEANAELQRMDHVKDEFIVTASHELRTPLSAISGYSSLLKRQSEHGRIDVQQVLKYSKKMMSSTQQLTDLVDNMTQAVRMGGLDKKLELQLVPISLPAATEAAVNMLNVGAEQRITSSMAEGLWVSGDALRLRQVITNLLENAIKYSPPHGRIQIMARSIPLSALPDNLVDFSIMASGENPEVVQVRVCDEGEGIAPEDAELIFEKFVRAPRSLTTPVRGTGLGLFICRRFIEAMGGRLWLEQSIPGKGSIFSFYLMRTPIPASKEDSYEPEPESATDHV